jgi:uncharacterized protein
MSADASAQASARPSFDCGRATTPTERRICESPELAGLDIAISQTYAAVKVDLQPDDQSRLLAEQRAWWQRRNKCEADSSCLERVMTERLSQLRTQQASTARQTSSRSATSSAPSAGITSTDRDGFYCVNGPKNKGTYSFALKERSDKNLEFGISLWWPDGKNFAVIGVAQPLENGWRYEDLSSQDPNDHCVMNIIPENRDYTLSINQASCQSNGGFQAVPSKVVFSEKTRQGGSGNVLANTEIFANTACRAKPASTSPPLKVEW